MKIVTAGDGFACSDAWLRWPQILEKVTENNTIISLGKVGAGNEYIFTSALDAIYNENPDLVLIQWNIPNRLDLLVDNDVKHSIAKNDTVYYDNIYKLGNNDWWLSSASKQEYVTNYHKQYIGNTQHIKRQENYIISMSAILKMKNIKYLFFSSYRLACFYYKNNVDWNDFVWYRPGLGMEEYSKTYRFKDTRGNNVQPSSYVNLCFLNEFVKSKLPELNWNEEVIARLLDEYIINVP